MSHLKVVCGPMWSGKSTYLMWERSRALIAKRKVLCIKPDRDTRTRGKIAIREPGPNGSSDPIPKFDAVDIEHAEHLSRVLAEYDFDFLIADECQFFPMGRWSSTTGTFAYGWFGAQILELLTKRAGDNLQIIVAGLNVDSEKIPFGAIPELLAIAEHSEYLTGICMVCGNEAQFSYRKKDVPKQQIVVGDKEFYEVRCRLCHAL